MLLGNLSVVMMKMQLEPSLKVHLFGVEQLQAENFHWILKFANGDFAKF